VFGCLKGLSSDGGNCGVGYFRALLRSFGLTKLRRQAFAVGLVVAVPAAQGGVAGVGEKKWQRRRFNVAVAKDHVGERKIISQ